MSKLYSGFSSSYLLGPSLLRWLTSYLTDHWMKGLSFRGKDHRDLNVITRSRRPGYYHSVRKRVTFSFPSRNAEFRPEQEITVEKIEGAYYTLYGLIPIVNNFFFLIHPRYGFPPT